MTRGLLEDAKDQRTRLAHERDAASHTDFVVLEAEVLDMTVGAPAAVHDAVPELAALVERGREEGARGCESREVDADGFATSPR